MMILNLLRVISRDEKGQGMVEYGLIIALVAIVAAAVLTPMGSTIASVFQNITSTLASVLGSGS